MKNFYLKISSKNKESLKYFCLNLFCRINKKQNFKIIQKCKNFRPKLKKITLLKSPHVYKTAQEQFEYKIFKKKFDVLVTNYRKFLIFLKKIKTNRFSDINIQLFFKIQKFNNFFITTFVKNNFNYFIVNNFFFRVKKKNYLFVITHKKIKKKKKKIFLNIKKKKNIKQFLNAKIKTLQKFLKILDIIGEKSLSSNTVCLDSSVGRAKD